MSANTIDIEKDYKEKVVQIWNAFSGITVLGDNAPEYRKSPLLPKEIIKNSLLFIGLNPSFTEKTVISEDERLIGFYGRVDELNNKDIQYFEKFKEVANYCNTDWSHLDLFFIRETNQKVIEGLSYSSVAFLNSQFNVV